MSDTQTTEAAVAQPSETPDTKPASATPDQTQPKTDKGKGGEAVGEKIHRLLELEKKNPGHRHNDEDLTFLEDEYYSGKNKPTKPLSVEKDDPDEGEQEPEKSPEGEETEAPEKKDEKPKLSKEIEDAMKEVGAKTPEELHGKIKELRKQLSGKDAQTVATLQKRIQSEVALIEDVKKGVPEAIQHFESAYGIKIARPGQEPQQPQQQDQKPFSDEDDALVGGALSRMYEMVKQAQETAGGVKTTLQQEQERLRKEGAAVQAKAQVMDEALTVANLIPELKAVPNLRALIATQLDPNAADDPRLAPLKELFDLAASEGVSLTVAHKMKKADDAEKLIAEAEARGRASAYNHKPNPSLSGLTGGKGETTTYTEEQINEMVGDHTKHPADWYDEQDNLIPSKIPKRWRSKFGF